MDYTTLTQVLGLIGNGTNPTPRPTPAPYDDTVIGAAITAASRSIDRMVTGDSTHRSDNYFMTGTLTDELISAQVNRNGDILIFLHKPECSPPSALGYQYRYNPALPWQILNTNLVTVDDYAATVWNGQLAQGPILIKATYAGGLGAATEDLPDDIQRAAAILAARYFKEGKTGLGDVMGIAELGTVVYTKAVPLEVLQILNPYTRPTPW